MGREVIAWEPFPGPQEKAWLVEANQIFFSGGRGSGKSQWLCGRVLKRLFIPEWRRVCNMIFFRRQYKDLEDLISKCKELFEDKLKIAKFVGGNVSSFIFKGDFNGSVLKMRVLDSAKQFDDYKGHEYNLMGFDEICDFRIPLASILDRMGGSLRNKHGIPCDMLFTGNPGGFNHGCVKKYFIDPNPDGGRLIINKHGQSRITFKSTYRDNPVYANDRDYINWLKSIREPALRKAWMDNDWDVALGAMFVDVWDKNVHVVKTIGPSDIPKNIARYRALDWGSSTPFCVLWFFVANGEELHNGMCFPNGAIVVYRELYGWEVGTPYDQGVKWTSSQLAKKISDIELNTGDTEVRPGPADNAIFNETNGTISTYDDFRKIGIKFTRSDKSTGSIKMGVEQIRNRLDMEPPMLYFTEDCTNTRRTLPEITRSISDPDKPEAGQEDHSFDVTKYICLRYLRAPKTIQQIKDRTTKRERELNLLKKVNSGYYDYSDTTKLRNDSMIKRGNYAKELKRMYYEN